MSQSGVPGVSQVASVFSGITSAAFNTIPHIGEALNPKPPAPAAASSTPSQDDPGTGDQMQNAENQVRTKRGEAANIFAGGSGLDSQLPSVSRAVLLGY